MAPQPDTTSASERTFLTQDEGRRLLAVITGTRDRALFPLAYHQGRRASEVSLLQRQAIHARQGRSDMPRVKGSISTTESLQPEDLRRLRGYRCTREDDSPALFISNRGLPLERRSDWDLMQLAGERAGIAKAKRRRRRAIALLAHGCRHALGTLRRIAAVRQVHGGVRYHPAPIGKIWRGVGWRGVGWRGQVPERQPIPRDESAMAHWKRSPWPAPKTSPPPGSVAGLPG